MLTRRAPRTSSADGTAAICRGVSISINSPSSETRKLRLPVSTRRCGVRMRRKPGTSTILPRRYIAAARTNWERLMNESE
jgi:hypothetical protein